MNIAEFLDKNTRLLSGASIDSARLDSLILLEDALLKNRSYILAHPEVILNAKQLAKLDEQIKRRVKHEPLAYIRGKVEFFGQPFVVNKDVLIPRPESEDIISLVLRYLVKSAGQVSVADVGTGSGCLGITVSHQLQTAKVDLYDISHAALKVAHLNSKELDVKINAYYNEDLLSNARNRIYDVVITNLPYVPIGFPINYDASYEPKIAIYSLDNGLKYYHELWQQLSEMEHKVAVVVTESLEFQHNEMISIADTHGYHLSDTIRLAQLFTGN